MPEPRASPSSTVSAWSSSVWPSSTSAAPVSAATASSARVARVASGCLGAALARDVDARTTTGSSPSAARRRAAARGDLGRGRPAARGRRSTAPARSPRARRLERDAAASASESAPPESATSTSGSFACAGRAAGEAGVSSDERARYAPGRSSTDGRSTARTARRTSAIGGVSRGRRSAGGSVGRHQVTLFRRSRRTQAGRGKLPDKENQHGRVRRHHRDPEGEPQQVRGRPRDRSRVPRPRALHDVRLPDRLRLLRGHARRRRRPAGRARAARLPAVPRRRREGAPGRRAST